MVGLIRFVAVFGGVAATAQVASGIVRGVKEVCHGRPVTGLVVIADGFAAPIVTACQEVSRFGKEVYDAVTSPWKEGTPETLHEQPTRAKEVPVEVSRNGMASVAVEG